MIIHYNPLIQLVISRVSCDCYPLFLDGPRSPESLSCCQIFDGETMNKVGLCKEPINSILVDFIHLHQVCRVDFAWGFI